MNIIIHWPHRVFGQGFCQICHGLIANKSQLQQWTVYDIGVILVDIGDWNSV